MAANVENLTLTGVAAINATGNMLANVLTGNSGDNLLSGLAGADTMIGGFGNDRYIVDSALDRLIEDVDQGLDSVAASFTWTLGDNFENLTLTGVYVANGIGNALDNAVVGNSAANLLSGLAGDDVLIGNVGADTLKARTGNDSMDGGIGNDVYFVDSQTDIVIERASGGIDQVVASVTWTLGADVEILSLIGLADLNGTGNALANQMIGNAGNNILSGGLGATR